uniref:ANK_REP_REGION domain-containing protein n=1 Tax=Mesocestoides corti TaxID=53468 RepID=A0A5K3FRE5_MESCO
LNKTGTTEQTFLTNRKPQLQVIHRPSESTTLALMLIKNNFSYVSVSDWTPIFLACHWNGEGHRIG